VLRCVDAVKSCFFAEKKQDIALFTFVKAVTWLTTNLRRYSCAIGICASAVKLLICTLNGHAGVVGSHDMHMLLARSAIERGMQLVAGMLHHRDTSDVRKNHQDRSSFQLVSWQPGAHSRREDELARRRHHPFA
jgi:hypothetical protein